MGLFDFLKKNDGSQCPYCNAKDISPAAPEQAEIEPESMAVHADQKQPKQKKGKKN